MVYTTDDLLASVKLNSYLPPQINFTDQQFLELGDDEIFNSLASLLVSFDQGYYQESLDNPFVAGQSVYSFPKYAMWNKIRRIDRISNGNIVYPSLRMITPDQIWENNSYQQGTPRAFLLNHDTIQFFPTPQAGITDLWRIWYYRRPGRMVLKSAAANVQSVNLATGQVTYAAVPPATFTASSYHDFYSSTPPFVRLQNNIQASALAGNVQTFPVASVQNLKQGDWVNILDETVFPPVPLELQPFLMELIVKTLTKTILDVDAYQVQRGEILERIKSVVSSAPGNRNVGQSIKMTQVRNGRLSWRRYYW